MSIRLSFEIVPISEVPAVESVTNLGGHTPTQTEDTNVSAGSSGTPEEEAVGYTVRGLPRGQKAWIKQEHGKYQVLVEGRGGRVEWMGDYPSLDDALQALSDKFMPGLFL